MVLQELIAFLEARDPSITAPMGFGRPHSYRGFYEQLAFEPTPNVTVGQMLTAARLALGMTFTGYKGGEYEMGEYTTVNLANYGETGEEIGSILLRYMVGEL